jgi:LPXTG-motif cell wall-anchored protein
VTVPANDSASLAYTCTWSSAPSPASGLNTATATWDAAAFFTAHGSAQGTATADFDAATPSVTDGSVDVVDSVVGSLGTVTASDPSPKTFTYQVTRPGVAGACTTYPNTATFTTDDSDTTGSDSASVEVCVGSDLTAAMTAAGSFDRTDLWAIAKDVDKTTVTLNEGETAATFAYTVTATPSGSTETGQVVGGTVTVSNPNSWEDVTADVTVTTDVGGNPTCTVNDGQDAVIPKAGSLQLAYTCSFTGAPAHSGTASASVAWDAAAASTPGSAAASSTPVTLSLDGETDWTVTVVDDKTDPANPVVLGPALWADGVSTFTYTIEKAAPAACTTYTNTASLVPTGQSAKADVEVCPFTGGGGTIVVPQLPHTGDSTGLLLRIGGGMLLLGLALLTVSRRRRPA